MVAGRAEAAIVKRKGTQNKLHSKYYELREADELNSNLIYLGFTFVRVSDAILSFNFAHGEKFCFMKNPVLK